MLGIAEVKFRLELFGELFRELIQPDTHLHIVGCGIMQILVGFGKRRPLLTEVGTGLLKRNRRSKASPLSHHLVQERLATCRRRLIG